MIKSLNEIKLAAQHVLDNMPERCYTKSGYTCHLIEDYADSEFDVNPIFTGLVLSEISPSYISTVLNPRLAAAGIRLMSDNLSSFIIRYWGEVCPDDGDVDKLFALRQEWLKYVIDYIDNHSEELVEALLRGN